MLSSHGDVLALSVHKILWNSEVISKDSESKGSEEIIGHSDQRTHIDGNMLLLHSEDYADHVYS